MTDSRHSRLARAAITWPDAPASASIGFHDIDVFAVALDEPDAATRALVATLSPQERARANRFHFPVDRDRFMVGRAVLRGLLSRYTAQAPRDIALRDTARGKPLLDPGIADTLHFNVSHSRGLALIAITQRGELGIDVEAMHDIPDLLNVAERYFAPAERAIVRELDGDARIAAFFTCWTRKEAYIKAIGEGLAHPLDRFVVAVRPRDAVRFVEIGDDAAEASAWSLADLRPAPGYAGAVAIRATDAVIRCWRW